MKPPRRALNATYADHGRNTVAIRFVVVMVPYSPATHHLIGAAELALMKPSAIFINTARGGVVDDVALIAALKDKRISGAGIDVFEGRPVPGFLELDNVTHAAHRPRRARRVSTVASLAVKNLVAGLSGRCAAESDQSVRRRWRPPIWRTHA